MRQRKAASEAAKRKRHIERQPKPVDIFAPLPKDAPNSAHQSRAALIRQHRLKSGELPASSAGGRHKVPRFCLRCGEEQPSAREAQNHCRVARKAND